MGRYGQIWGDVGRYGEIRGEIPLLGRCSWPVHTSARYLRSNAFEGSSSILRKIWGDMGRCGQLEHPAPGDGAGELRKRWRGEGAARTVRRRGVWKAPRCVRELIRAGARRTAGVRRPGSAPRGVSREHAPCKRARVREQQQALAPKIEPADGQHARQPARQRREHRRPALGV